MTSTEQLKKALQDPDVIKAIQDSLAKETPTPQGKPKFGDTYWIIRIDGSIFSHKWAGDDFDNNLYKRGLVFKTEEEARFYDFKRMLMTDLQRIADKGEPSNWTTFGGFVIKLNKGGSQLVVDDVFVRILGSVIFPTKELADEAIDLHGDDIIKMMKGIE